jgi:glycerol uptake facilitator protein
MKHTLTSEYIAELLGTLVLLMIGDGVVAMTVLFGPSGGGYTNITLCWGLAVAFGVYIAGRVSGAHLNPAVTIALAVFKGFSWRKVLPYIAAQMAGAFAGAAIVFINYRPAILKFDPLLEKSAGIFTTFPAFPAAPLAGLLDQVLGTALLMILILAVIDENNYPAGNLAPLVIGLTVVAVGMSWGGMHGYAINPARDFGPRLFTAVAGFTHNGLTDGSGVFWVPLVGPVIGALVGAGVFQLASIKKS